MEFLAKEFVEEKTIERHKSFYVVVILGASTCVMFVSYLEGVTRSWGKGQTLTLEVI